MNSMVQKNVKEEYTCKNVYINNRGCLLDGGEISH